VNYGSAGVGSTEHMAGELFRAVSGTSIVHVPYRGGSPMLADLMAAHIQMALEPSGASAPFVKSGKIRALAVSRASARPSFPICRRSMKPDSRATTSRPGTASSCPRHSRTDPARSSTRLSPAS